jgi:hypothetical protein
MTQQMSNAKDCVKFGLKKIHQGKFVLVRLWDSYHRGEILAYQEDKLSGQCFLPDIGMTTEIPLADMAMLPPAFTKVPFQV